MAKIIACFLLFTFSCIHYAQAYDYPTMKPFQSYSASYKARQFSLILEQQTFIWTQRENGKSPSIITGKWKQLQQGETLQLSNRSGYLRLLQVGATGNLYWDHAEGYEIIPLVMKLDQTFPDIACRPLLGHASMQNGRFLIHDDQTGLDFHLQGDDDVPHLENASYIQADACSSSRGGDLRLVAWLVAPKPRFLESTPSIFQERVASRVWKGQATGLIRKLHLPDIVIQFDPLTSGDNNGELTILFLSERIKASYKSENDTVILSQINSRSQSLCSFFNVPLNWSLEGNILTLIAPGGNRIECEKIS